MKVIINHEISWFLGKEEQTNAGWVQGTHLQPPPGTNPGHPQANAIRGGRVQTRGRVYRRATLKAQQQINPDQSEWAVCYTRRCLITLMPQRSNLKAISKYPQLSMLGELQKNHHAKTQWKERIRRIRKNPANTLEKATQHRTTLLVQNKLCLREYRCITWSSAQANSASERCPRWLKCQLPWVIVRQSDKQRKVWVRPTT